jgi:cytochrome c oxidase assembly factor CtaG
MDPTLRAILTSWDWRLDVITVLLTFGTLYTIGWQRLRRKQAKLATNWRIAAYYAGLLSLVIALMSGIDTFQTQLFFIHMTQHIVLVMIAPPLLLIANPMPFLLWAIPRQERQLIAGFLTQKSRFRRMFVKLTAPGLVWLFYAINLWLWHDPNPYNEAIVNDTLHDIEHLTFFLTGMALWWHITNAAPYFHGRRTYAMRIALVIATYFQNLLIGVGITMSGTLIYTYYAGVPRVWGIDPIRDQTIGGLIMWIPGGMMYLMALLGLIALAVQESERRARLADSQRRLKFGGVPSA